MSSQSSSIICYGVIIFCTTIYFFLFFFCTNAGDETNTINTTVTFTPDGPRKLTVNFNFIRRGGGNEVIELQLEVVKPIQFIDLIEIGNGDSNLYSSLTLELIDDFGMTVIILNYVT